MAREKNSETSARRVDEIEVALQALDARLAKQRAEYEQFVESIRALPGPKRAYAWLSHIGQHIEDNADQEALIFLRSTHPVSNQVTHVGRERDSLFKSYSRQAELCSATRHTLPTLAHLTLADALPLLR